MLAKAGTATYINKLYNVCHTAGNKRARIGGEWARRDIGTTFRGTDMDPSPSFPSAISRLAYTGPETRDSQPGPLD
eukprot:1347638-Pyramimonas_sp.AAC.1